VFLTGLLRRRPAAAVLLGLTLAGGPAWAGQPWPWGVQPGQIMGQVALVLVTSAEKVGGQPPLIERLQFYPCDRPGCEDRPGLDLLYAVPAQNLAEGRFHYLVLDLPPGGYRLAGIEGQVKLTEKSLAFEFPLHYIFRVREAKCNYLGRLNLELRPKIKPSEDTAVDKNKLVRNEGKERPKDLSFSFAVLDRFDLDARALLRNFPERRFYELAVDKMIWLKK